MVVDDQELHGRSGSSLEIRMRDPWDIGNLIDAVPGRKRPRRRPLTAADPGGAARFHR
ncbi:MULTISPECIES: hypothetical protein [unclassified Methylobacterium]|uniref:hypothetical protein n=1 Tax=unclassified Methylobacterium TaxID=2615210 RepID=UPI00164F4CB4|nr:MULTISPECIES: hypothetical protein [unclassified Methylobacterium]